MYVGDMKVLNDNVGALSNFELAELLKQQAQERSETESRLPLPGARRGASSNAVTWQAQQEVAEQILTYLEQTECMGQTRESIITFTTAVAKFNLTQAEMISLVNTAPRSRVEVYLIIEECEERLSPDSVAELLQLCNRLHATNEQLS